MLNDTELQFATNQKYLVLILDSRLELNEHIHNKIIMRDKVIGTMKIRLLALSRKISLTIYNKNNPLLMLNDT